MPQFWELVLTELKLFWSRGITTLSGFETAVLHLRDPTGRFGPMIGFPPASPSVLLNQNLQKKKSNKKGKNEEKTIFLLYFEDLAIQPATYLLL